MRSVNEVLGADGWRLRKTIPGRTEGAMRSDVAEIYPTGVFQNVPKIIPEVLPTRVRSTAYRVGWRDTQVPVLARVVHQVWVHEQHLIAGHEVFPGIVAILLRRLVPHLPVRMVTIIDVHLAGWMPVSAGRGRRNFYRRRNPVRIRVVKRCIRAPDQRRVPNGVLMRLSGLIGSDVRNLVVVPPHRVTGSFLGNDPQHVG